MVTFMPQVCLTPAPPAPSTIPYPNLGMSTDTAKDIMLRLGCPSNRINANLFGSRYVGHSFFWDGYYLLILHNAQARTSMA